MNKSSCNLGQGLLMTTRRWDFLTNHADVLVCAANDPGARLRDIAASVGITERAAHRILSELVEAGYVVRERDGRRNRYEVKAELPLRGPLGKGRGSVSCSRCWAGPKAVERGVGVMALERPARAEGRSERVGDPRGGSGGRRRIRRLSGPRLRLVLRDRRSAAPGALRSELGQLDGPRSTPSSSSRRRWASAAAMAPSPTAPATRLVEPWRTSPAAKRPGTLVSRASGSRSSGQGSGRRPCSSRSGPVRT